MSEAVSRIPEYLKLTCEGEDQLWAGNIPEGGFGNLDKSQTFMQVEWVRVWRKRNSHPELISEGNHSTSPG